MSIFSKSPVPEEVEVGRKEPPRAGLYRRDIDSIENSLATLLSMVKSVKELTRETQSNLRSGFEVNGENFDARLSGLEVRLEERLDELITKIESGGFGESSRFGETDDFTGTKQRGSKKNSKRSSMDDNEFSLNTLKSEIVETLASNQGDLIDWLEKALRRIENGIPSQSATSSATETRQGIAPGTQTDEPLVS